MTWQCGKCYAYNSDYYKDEDGDSIERINCEECGESGSE